MALGPLYKQMMEGGPLAGAKTYSGLKAMKETMDERKEERALKAKREAMRPKGMGAHRRGSVVEPDEE